MRQRLPTSLLTGLLVLGGLAAGLLLAELGLRVYAPLGGNVGVTLQNWDPYRLRVEPHGHLGYRQKPGFQYAYDNNTVATTNAMGFRGPSVSIPKPEGTTRIVLLGGSATHGFGADDAETIDAHMRALLAERYPGRRFEVVNLAFDGYDSYQLLARLRSDGLRLEPDILIVNTGINDVRNARFEGLVDADPRTVLWLHIIRRMEAEEQRGGPGPWTRLKHHSYLARLPGTIRFVTGRDPDTAEPQWMEGNSNVFPDAIEYFGRNLRTIADEALESDVAAVIFSVAPSALPFASVPETTARRGYWLATPEATQDYRDRLGERMRSLTKELAAEGRTVSFVEHSLTAEMFLDDAHLTPRGNQRVAEGLVEAVAGYLAERP